MTEQDSIRSASATSEKRASWLEDTHRILPLLFERHPAVARTIEWYGSVFFFGYAILAFFADVGQWQWFKQWLELSAPVTNGLRSILPFIGTLTHAILAKGAIVSANAVGHVLTFSVMFSALTFAFGCAGIFSRNDEDWGRLNSTIPQRRLVQIAVVNGLVFAVFAAYGIATSIWLADWFFVPALFYVGAVFGLNLLIAACATWRGRLRH
jgi:hypothetical protein